MPSVNILDSIYEIGPSDRIHARNNWGECCPNSNNIFLDSTLTGQKYEQVLVHEIIEGINFEYNVQMKHDTLTMLANAVYLFFKQIKPYIKEGEIEIPKQIDIGFSTYKIIIDDAPTNHDHYLQSSFLQYFINISQDLVDPVKLWKYFVYSVLGAIRQEYDLRLSEHQVDLLATGIAKFIRDNHNLFEVENVRRSNGKRDPAEISSPV